MKKILFIITAIISFNAHAFDSIRDALGTMLPDAVTDGAKTGTAMLLGLKKQHNVHISIDEPTLAFLMLKHREEIGLTDAEANDVKKYLLDHILTSKKDENVQTDNPEPKKSEPSA